MSDHHYYHHHHFLSLSWLSSLLSSLLLRLSIPSSLLSLVSLSPFEVSLSKVSSIWPIYQYNQIYNKEKFENTWTCPIKHATISNCCYCECLSGYLKIKLYSVLHSYSLFFKILLACLGALENTRFIKLNQYFAHMDAYRYTKDICLPQAFETLS